MKTGVGDSVPGAPSAAGGSHFRFDLGLLRHGQRDLAASPVNYAGTVPAMGLGYLRARPGSRFEVGAEFAHGNLTSRLTADDLPREEAWVGRIGLRYMLKAGALLDGRVIFLAGGQIDAHALFRVHRYLDMSGGSEPYGDLLVPIQVVGGWDWGTGEGDTRGGHRLAVPVFGVVMRTPYFGLKGLAPLELAPPGELRGFDHELFVERDLSRRLGVRATWLLRVFQHSEPRDLRVAEHRLTLSGLLRP